MKKLLLIILLLIPININAASASSYIVMDMDNGRVLQGSNIHESYLTASIAKIMTAIVVINNSDIKTEVTIGEEVLKSHGSGIYVEVGEKITIEYLLYGLMLRSGNDAAIALAYEVGGSMEGFAYLMNETARNIGMKNTNFVNSHGLEENNGDGNKSTAYDMALLSSYAMQNDIYRRISSTKDITVKTNKKTYRWYNKNRLLNSYEFCTGGKTGFTTLARRTLVTTATKDDVNLTIVTFKGGNDFNDHEALYNKYFNKLSNYQLVKEGNIETKRENSYINEDFRMSLTKEEREKIDIRIHYANPNATKVIGKLVVSLDGNEYFRTKIFVREATPKLTIWQRIRGWFS